MKLIKLEQKINILKDKIYENIRIYGYTFIYKIF